jgi:hypothetical protein
MELKTAIAYSLYLTLFLCVCLYLQKGLVEPINDPWFVPIVVSVAWGAYNADN